MIDDFYLFVFVFYSTCLEFCIEGAYTEKRRPCIEGEISARGGLSLKRRFDFVRRIYFVTASDGYIRTSDCFDADGNIASRDGLRYVAEEMYIITST
jgi:hypothetical protein